MIKYKDEFVEIKIVIFQKMIDYVKVKIVIG